MEHRRSLTFRTKVSRFCWSRYCVGHSFLLGLMIFIVYFNQHKCKMEGELKPLLLNIVDTWTSEELSYILDYGTLLGAYRDKGIIPFEFDLDMSIFTEEYPRLMDMKQLFAERYGYYLYGRGDFISMKYWQLGNFGSGYLHSPCARIYDENKIYFTDIYCYGNFTRDEVKKWKEEDVGWERHVPADFETNPNPEGGFLCNAEDCVKRYDMLPLETIHLFGRNMTVPRDIPTHLTQLYGPEYMTPQPKGINAVFCSNHITFISVNVLLGFMGALYFYQMRRLQKATLTLE